MNCTWQILKNMMGSVECTSQAAAVLLEDDQRTAASVETAEADGAATTTAAASTGTGGTTKASKSSAADKERGVGQNQPGMSAYPIGCFSTLLISD